MAERYGTWKDSLLCAGIAIFFGAKLPSLSAQKPPLPDMKEKYPEGHNPKYWRQHPARLEAARKKNSAVSTRSQIPQTESRQLPEIGNPITALLVLVVTIGGFVIAISTEIYPVYFKAIVSFAGLVLVALEAWNLLHFARIKRSVTTMTVVAIYILIVCFPLRMQYMKEYDLNLEFTDAESLSSWWTRMKINWNFAKARNYLQSLSIPIADMPRIDIRVFNDPIQATPPEEPAYRGRVNLSDDDLRDPKGQTNRYIYYQLSRTFFPDTSKVPTWRALIFPVLFDMSDYLNSSLWNEPVPTLNKSFWGAKLWAIRERFGKLFTDKIVGYTIVSIGDSPDEGKSDQPDIYICRHLKIGEARLDHDARKWSEILEILTPDGDHQFHRFAKACNATNE